MMNVMCDECKENEAYRMVTVAVRGETTIDGDVSVRRIEFKQVPYCRECLKVNRTRSRGAKSDGRSDSTLDRNASWQYRNRRFSEVGAMDE